MVKTKKATFTERGKTVKYESFDGDVSSSKKEMQSVAKWFAKGGYVTKVKPEGKNFRMWWRERKNKKRRG